MAQRICAFITACDASMEAEAGKILQEMRDSPDSGDLTRFVFGLAGMTSGLLYTVGFIMGRTPSSILNHFGVMNEVAVEQSEELANRITKSRRPETDQ